MVKDYDSRCFDLAELFLDSAGISSTTAKERLALDIQQAIEDFISQRPSFALGLRSRAKPNKG